MLRTTPLPAMINKKKKEEKRRKKKRIKKIEINDKKGTLSRGFLFYFSQIHFFPRSLFFPFLYIFVSMSRIEADKHKAAGK